MQPVRALDAIEHLLRTRFRMSHQICLRKNLTRMAYFRKSQKKLKPCEVQKMYGKPQAIQLASPSCREMRAPRDRTHPIDSRILIALLSERRPKFEPERTEGEVPRVRQHLGPAGSPAPARQRCANQGDASRPLSSDRSRCIAIDETARRAPRLREVRRSCDNPCIGRPPHRETLKMPGTRALLFRLTRGQSPRLHDAADPDDTECTDQRQFAPPHWPRVVQISGQPSHTVRGSNNITICSE